MKQPQDGDGVLEPDVADARRQIGSRLTGSGCSDCHIQRWTSVDRQPVMEGRASSLLLAEAGVDSLVGVASPRRWTWPPQTAQRYFAALTRAQVILMGTWEPGEIQ